MTEPILRELLEAARPFVPALPQADWPCHAGTAGGLAGCAHCIRVLRFRAAIHAAEGAIR